MFNPGEHNLRLFGSIYRGMLAKARVGEVLMRQALFFIAALVFMAEAAAQCTDEQAWQKPGAWSHGDDTLARDHALPNSVRASALRKADAVVELVKRAIPD